MKSLSPTWRCCFFILAMLAALPVLAATLHRGNGVEPESIDPHRARGVETLNILRDVYEGLTRHAADGSVVAGVAERWEVSNDGLVYTFALRDAAKWSNGDRVVAEDFRFALRRALTPATGSPYAKVLDVIANAPQVIAGEAAPDALAVTAPDAKTLRIRLRYPAAHLPQLLALPVAFPVHRASLAPPVDAAAGYETPVSNGAYRITAWQVHGHMRLEKNPHYWNRDNVAIDTVIYYPVNDENAELSRFRAGELDITFTLPSRRIAWARETMPGALHLVPYLGTYFYGFNLTQPPFKGQPGLRRALSMVIDRELIANKILQSGDLPAWGWVPPGIAGYRAARLDYADWLHARRIATARELYRAAGYTPENPLRVELRFNTGDNHRRIALAVAAMWKQHLGVITRLVNEEWKVFIQNRRQQRITQVYRSSWIGDYNDPWTFLEVMHSEHGINDFGYQNSAYDEMLRAATNQPDVESRNRKLHAAEAMALADHPVIPLLFYVSKHMVSPRVGGWVDNPVDVHLSQYLFIRE